MVPFRFMRAEHQTIACQSINQSVKKSNPAFDRSTNHHSPINHSTLQSINSSVNPPHLQRGPQAPPLPLTPSKLAAVLQSAQQQHDVEQLQQLLQQLRDKQEDYSQKIRKIDEINRQRPTHMATVLGAA